MQKSLLDGKVVGKEVRRLSSALSLGSQPLSLGSKPGAGVGVRGLGRRGTRGRGLGFLIFEDAVGRMIPRVSISTCVASARSVISSTSDQ